jgi:hypothetical protein
VRVRLFEIKKLYFLSWLINEPDNQPLNFDSKRAFLLFLKDYRCQPGGDGKPLILPLLLLFHLI